MSLHTPVQIEVLLALRYRPNYDAFESKAALDAASFWIARGLVRRSGNDNHLELTDKGDYYLNHLLNQPLPEMQYYIPKQE